MRRPFIAASGLLIVVGLAGCAAPAAEPTESPEPTVVVTPTPEPPAETVEWTLPADCAGLAWESVRYAQETADYVIQPWDTENLPGWVGESEEMVSCISGPAASDATNVWSAARIDVSDQQAEIDAAIAAGYSVQADEMAIDAVRSVRLHRPVVEYGLGEDHVAVIGDAWLHIGNTSDHGGEALLGMAAQLGLPSWSDWVLPANCDDQITDWPEFAAFVEENGWGVEAMPWQTDSSGSLFARLGYPGLSVSCLWGLENSDWLHYLSVSRIDAAEREALLGDLEENGYVAAEQEGEHLLLLKDHGPESISGNGTDAAILTEDALVLAEALDGFEPERATSFVEQFAGSIGVID